MFEDLVNNHGDSSFSLKDLFNPLTNKKALSIIIIVGFIVFFNSLFNGFVWDDVGQILNNTKAHSIQNIAAFFEGGTFDPGNSVDKLSGTYYKPFMTTVFSIIYTFFGQQAFYFHFLQLLFHIANTIIVFFLLLYFFPKKLSLVLSLIFLIHPINVEAVSYISALQDVLFFFFGMLCLIIVIKNNQLKTKPQFAHLLLTITLLLCSLLSKEAGILFVIILPILVLLFHKRNFISYFFISLISLAIYLFLRFYIGKIYFSAIHISPISTVEPIMRLLSIPKIVLFYLQTFFIPYHLSVAQMWVVKNTTFQDFYAPLIIDTIFFLSILGLGIFFWSRKKYNNFKVYLFFVSWFLVGLALYLQIFPLDMTVADRWFYFPIIGLLGILGVIINNIKVKSKNTKIILQLLGITIILILSLRTIIRNTDWNTSYSLFSHDVAIDRSNFYLQNRLGIELFLLGRYSEARNHLEHSNKIFPTGSAFSNLGLISLRQGDLLKAENYFDRSIQIDKEYYPAYHNLAYVLLKSNNPIRARKIARKGVLLFPNNDQMWILLAFAEYKIGNQQNAIQAVKHAYNLSQTNYTREIYNSLINNQSIDSYLN